MNRPVRVLELRSVAGTGGGPDKTILAGAQRADPRFVAVTLCYLRNAADSHFRIGERARSLGLDYVEIVERHSLDPAVWPALTGLVREREFDVVHAHEYKTDLLAHALGTRRLVVPLATAHGWTGHSWRERRVYYPWDKRVLARFPKVLAVSSDVRNELVAAGADPSHVEVLLNGIDPGVFRRDAGMRAEARRAYGLDPDDVVIGAVGRLEPQKRFDLLVEVFARLARARPTLRLLIAGEGSARAALERQIAATSPRARLVGQVDVVPFHHALDLFVQSSAYEGTPNVVLEAMALETPIVATDVGGTIELAAPDGHALIVQPGDAPALESAIARALDDPAAAATRVAAARRRVETDLSFERRQRRLDEIYVALAGRIDRHGAST